MKRIDLLDITYTQLEALLHFLLFERDKDCTVEWKTIIENYVGASVIFLCYFVPMLWQNKIFDESGAILKGWLTFHVFILVMLFLGATLRVSIKLQENAKNKKQFEAIRQAFKEEVS